MNTFSVMWEKALPAIEEHFRRNNNQHAFETYVKALSPEYSDGDTYTFLVPNEYFREQIEFRLLTSLKEVFAQSLRIQSGVMPGNLQIRLITPEDRYHPTAQQLEEYHTSNPYISINPEYTFSNFVVGSSNQLAYGASVAVAENPGTIYNPLFIYGGVGLGKTHLLHAIANRILEDKPDARILYVTCETFIVEFTESIQKGRMEQFRERYRKADVLLIDDIQFITKKVETQAELFHTFNALKDMNSQIIFSSDKPPSEIPQVEMRLLSRFAWGLLTDIEMPDYETRVAILKNKMPMLTSLLDCDIHLDPEVFSYIASRDNTNIRMLEGMLKTLLGKAKLFGKTEVDADFARFHLRSFFSEPAQKVITPKLIIAKVCEHYDISVEDIMSKKKNREIAFPRQVAMYIMKTLTDMTNKKAGECVGVGDPSTVIHAQKKIAEIMEKDLDVHNSVNDIISKVKNA